MNRSFFAAACLLVAVVFAFPAFATEQNGSSTSATSSSSITPQQRFEANKRRLLDRIDQGDPKLQGQRDCIAQAQTPEAIHNNCRPTAR